MKNKFRKKYNALLLFSYYSRYLPSTKENICPSSDDKNFMRVFKLRIFIHFTYIGAVRWRFEDILQNARPRWQTRDNAYFELCALPVYVPTCSDDRAFSSS